MMVLYYSYVPVECRAYAHGACSMSCEVRGWNGVRTHEDCRGWVSTCAMWYGPGKPHARQDGAYGPRTEMGYLHGTEAVNAMWGCARQFIAARINRKYGVSVLPIDPLPPYFITGVHNLRRNRPITIIHTRCIG